MLNQRLKLKGFVNPAKKLLNTVAARLMKIHWPIDTTPDFVVYAVDLELADLEKNLRASIPAWEFARLKQAGLLNL